jgi:hypothetical protein
MARIRLLGRLGTAATAAVGVVIGPLATYVLAVGDEALRHSLLSRTGHGYLATAVAGALVIGAVTAASVVVRHLRPPPVHHRDESLLRFILRLGALQALIFAALEVTERMVSGASLGTLIDQHLLVLGLPVQLLVALAVALGLRALAAAATVVARAIRPRLVRSTTTAWPLPSSPSVPGFPPLAGAWGARGPPSR